MFNFMSYLAIPKEMYIYFKNTGLFIQLIKIVRVASKDQQLRCLLSPFSLKATILLGAATDLLPTCFVQGVVCRHKISTHLNLTFKFLTG